MSELKELKLQRSNSNSLRTMNRDSVKNTDLVIRNKANHKSVHGELYLDLEKNELIWKPIENNKDNVKAVTIQKNSIVDTKSAFKDTEEQHLEYILIVKNDDPKDPNYIFCFEGEDNTIIRDKYMKLLKGDIFPYYKTELKSLPIQTQKIISLLLKNKYLLKLFFHLFQNVTTSLDKIWNRLRNMYPQFMILSLSTNKIQLSRDEELLMFAKNTYNINKLLSADDAIKNAYISSNKNFENESYWEEYIEKQSCEKNYILGGYKEINNNGFQKNDKDSKNKKNVKLIEDIEKDKYYFDPYETNYLYHYTPNLSAMKEMDRNKQEYAKNLISLLNNYSINKINDMHFFSTRKGYLYNENTNNEAENKRDNILCNKGKKATNIMKKLYEMKNEYENSKLQEDNSYKDTMIKIKNENYERYEQYVYFKQNEKKLNKLHTEEILEEVQLIKDLIYFLYKELFSILDIMKYRDKIKDKEKKFWEIQIKKSRRIIEEGKKHIEKLIRTLKQKSEDSLETYNRLIKNVENYYYSFDANLKLYYKSNIST